MRSLQGWVPKRVCLLRLSALGDTCHVLPLLRTLQQAWPTTQFSWVIGRGEARLMSLLSDVELIPVRKGGGWREYWALRTKLRHRGFDALLHLQLSLRASVVATAVRAPVKLGFDRARARELQGLFTNHAIAARSREHVLDSFFGFAEAFGVHERVLRWDVPLPEAAQQYARRVLGEAQRTLVISPCSSRAVRNWRPERYAAVADHAVAHHGMRVILCGGPTEQEKAMGAAIQASAQHPLINQIGQDTLPELLAVLAGATVVLTPDSGPAHMATMVGTPVLGLYAATQVGRTGPYLSRDFCVDRFDEAARQFRGRAAGELPWTTKIEQPGVMDLIEVPDVIEKLRLVLASGALERP